MAGKDDMEPGAADQGDPLVLCLSYMVRHFGSPRPLKTLIGDAPRAEGRLALAGFRLAVERAGLTVEERRIPLGRIGNLTLPAVLLLEGGDACVLSGLKQGRALIVGPVAGAGETWRPLSELEEIYTGVALFVRHPVRYDRDTEGLPESRADRWLWDTIFADRKVYVHAALGTAFINVLALVVPFVTSIVFDRVVPHRAIETLNILCIGAAIAIGFDFLVRGARAHMIDTLGRRTDALLSSRIMRHIFDMKLGSGRRSAGGLTNTVREFEAVREFFASATLAALSDLPFALLFVAVIWLIAGPLALIPLAAFLAILAFALVVILPLDRIVQKNYQNAGYRHALLVEYLGNLETIKAIRAEFWAHRRWDAFTGQGAMLNFEQRRLTQLINHFTNAMYVACPIATLYFGVLQLKDEALTTGALFACTMLNSRVLAPLGQITGLLARLRHTMQSLKSINDLMRAPLERSAELQQIHPDRIEGAIEFRAVHFSYPGRKSEALSDVRLTIRPGERVAVLGRTGSGKTTIARLMLNLFEPDKGAVLVDGLDARQIDPHALRRSVAYVPQDIQLFAGTVRENIVVGAPWTEGERVLEVARAAGLETLLADSAEGLDRRVGERGEGLSGGQRQGISIARAMLLDPSVLLLDEPTSMMDSQGEAAFKATLANWLGRRTLVVITHRSSLLSLVDRIVVIDRGRIVADGPRDEVLRLLRDGRAASSAPLPASAASLGG